MPDFHIELYAGGYFLEVYNKGKSLVIHGPLKTQYEAKKLRETYENNNHDHIDGTPRSDAPAAQPAQEAGQAD